MKYCDKCALKFGFPQTAHMHDNVACDLCSTVTDCNQASVDELTSFLVPLKTAVQNGQVAQKLLDTFYTAAYQPASKEGLSHGQTK